MTESKTKDNWFERLSPEEQEKIRKESSERSSEYWADPQRRAKQKRVSKKYWKDNEEELRAKQKEGLERSKRKMRILLGLESD